MISNMESSDKLFQTNSSLNEIIQDESKKIDPSQNFVQVGAKRWVILGIFSLVTLLNAFNWIEYNIIQDVTIAFFNASLPQDKAQQNDTVNWLSMVYMLCYIPLVFPAMFLLDRKGLKLSIVLGALFTTIGN